MKGKTPTSNIELHSNTFEDEDYHPSLDSNDGIYSFENKFSTSDPISFYHQYISM